MDAVVCVIVLNEEKYIDEWLEHNKKLGFSKVYMYDNSDDNTMKNYESDFVHVIHLPGKVMQSKAYEHFFNNFGKFHKWCAVIDVDEFIVLKKHDNIIQLCLEYIPIKGALGINWVFFGSNGHEKYSPEPVTKRFTKRQKGVNEHIKCIVNTSSVTIYDHPHYPINCPIIDTNGNMFINTPFNHLGDDRVVQLNHYVVKSREECTKKCLRGRADSSVHNDHLTYFDYFESLGINDVEEEFR